VPGSSGKDSSALEETNGSVARGDAAGAATARFEATRLCELEVTDTSPVAANPSRAVRIRSDLIEFMGEFMVSFSTARVLHMLRRATISGPT
jgi:hypothetical protein